MKLPLTPFPLVAGSYLSRSRKFDAQRTVNFFAEASGSGNSKSIAMLIGTPGCLSFARGDGNPVRGMLVFSSTIAIFVSGNTVWRMNTDGTATTIGAPILISNEMVSMASNGTVVMLVTGGWGYVIDPLALTSTQIVDPAFLGADKVDFVDGYFVFNKPATQQYQITSLYGTAIDPLDFASAEGAPDLLVSLIVDHAEIWLFGETTTEVHANSGNPDFPFERIQGAFMEQGCAAKFSVAKLHNTVVWLTKDERGHGTVQKSVGYQPQRISDHALEFAMQGYSRIDDAIAYTYQQEGHSFYMLTFPEAGKTWCFDFSTELWHERRYDNPVTQLSERHLSQCHMFYGGKNLVGSWKEGGIYELDLDYYQDDGVPMHSIRQCPHLAAGDLWQFFHEIWIDMETGVGLTSGTGSDPTLFLEWSDDGGYSFPNSAIVHFGKIGERTLRAVARRLGKSRDRVFRITITDPVKRILINAACRVTVAAA